MNRNDVQNLRFWLLVQLASSWSMVGLVWFVQLVHYPLMRLVQESRFVEYESLHRQQISFIVGPCMLAQLGSAIFISMRRMKYPWCWICNVGIILVIWVSTFTVQVPLHDILNRGFDENTHAQLVHSNWLRTILWTVQAFLVTGLVYQFSTVNNAESE